MRRLLLIALLALAACAGEEPAPEAPAVSFRDRGVPIGSTTRSAGALAGEWVIAQSFPGTPFAAPGTRVTVVTGTDGAGVLRFAGPNGVSELDVVGFGSGRLRVEGAAAPELWLLWVDDDARSAVIGTPDGSLGWIMDRPGEASQDRTRAAREVLDFNGYDVARLSST